MEPGVAAEEGEAVAWEPPQEHAIGGWSCAVLGPCVEEARVPEPECGPWVAKESVSQGPHGGSSGETGPRRHSAAAPPAAPGRAPATVSTGAPLQLGQSRLERKTGKAVEPQATSSPSPFGITGPLRPP